jgi:hypothetical protein
MILSATARHLLERVEAQLLSALMRVVVDKHPGSYPVVPVRSPMR